MRGIKDLSWPSLAIGFGGGFVIGALVLGIFVNYLISNAISNKSTDGQFLGSTIEQVRQGMAQTEGRKEQKSLYGQVVSIGGGTLTIAASQLDGTKKNLTFKYDDHTVFVYLANDSASTPTPLSTDNLAVGSGVTIDTNEPVGSVENQYAVKVTRI
jgi:hypothetical protein